MAGSPWFLVSGWGSCSLSQRTARPPRASNVEGGHGGRGRLVLPTSSRRLRRRTELAYSRGMLTIGPLWDGGVPPDTTIPERADPAARAARAHCASERGAVCRAA